MKMVVTLALILLLTLLLLGCSQKPQAIYKTETLTTPDYLLSNPCKGNKVGVGAEVTVRDLVRSYIVNTNCLAQYERLLEKNRQYKKEVESMLVE